MVEDLHLIPTLPKTTIASIQVMGRPNPPPPRNAPLKAAESHRRTLPTLRETFITPHPSHRVAVVQEDITALVAAGMASMVQVGSTIPNAVMMLMQTIPVNQVAITALASTMLRHRKVTKVIRGEELGATRLLHSIMGNIMTLGLVALHLVEVIIQELHSNRMAIAMVIVTVPSTTDTEDTMTREGSRHHPRTIRCTLTPTTTRAGMGIITIWITATITVMAIAIGSKHWVDLLIRQPHGRAMEAMEPLVVS